MNKLIWIDILVFVLYMAIMLCVGIYFFKKNKSKEDYYVGSRSMSAGHIGLSVVATDVGGGFSIGLGGLGFVMGISGSWMLFTGLLGAWLSTVFLIPKIYPLARMHGFLSFPDALNYFYDKKVGFLAGIISFIGYVGFTSSQVLAGAKLASATFESFSLSDAVWLMGVIAIIYTVAGGIKAVIYTDTVQWLILMGGMFFIGIPLGYFKLGGWNQIHMYMPLEFMSLCNISLVQFINWMLTIVPIWFIGMTLYQRIYACRDQKTAIKAWRIAGLFEWPVMAFLGVILGMFAKIAWNMGMFSAWGYEDSIDPELGLPIFLKNILPAGILGLMMSSYFSAIMSTADSCLMAASGNLMSDIIRPFNQKIAENIRYAQIATFVIGLAAVFIALHMQEVLTLMLHSYAFMVSGLLIPVIMMLYEKAPSANAALSAMIAGGCITLGITFLNVALPFGLDPIFYGLLGSFMVYKLVRTWNHYF